MMPTISPNLRRALHRALDLVLDALEADARELAEKRPKRTRVTKEPSMPKASPAAREHALKVWERQGFKRTDAR